MKAIILAAGLGRRLRQIIDMPKCLLKIKDSSLIQRYILSLGDYGLKEMVIVVGYKKDSIIKEVKKFKDLIKIKIINNPDFSKGSILSLWRARNELGQDTLLIDGDVYFESRVVKKIFSSKKKNFFLIDTSLKDDPEAVMVGFRNKQAVALGRGLKGKYDVLGEWAGFLRLSTSASRSLKKIIERRVKGGDRDTGYEFIVPELFKKSPISYELVDGLNWVEIDFPRDLKRARLCRA